MLEKHALEAPCERPLRLETPWKRAGSALGMNLERLGSALRLPWERALRLQAPQDRSKNTPWKRHVNAVYAWKRLGNALGTLWA